MADKPNENKQNQLSLWTQDTLEKGLIGSPKSVFQKTAIVDKKTQAQVGNVFSIRKRKDIAEGLGLANNKENRGKILEHEEAEQGELLARMKVLLTLMEAGQYGGRKLRIKRDKNGLQNFSLDIRELPKRGKLTEEEEVELLNRYSNYQGKAWTVDLLREAKAKQLKDTINVESTKVPETPALPQGEAPAVNQEGQKAPMSQEEQDAIAEAQLEREENERLAAEQKETVNTDN